MDKTTIIRDCIHYDIEFSNDIMDIMDTAEFQRLHRIKQLSCEYLIFPTATHTRFAHSIGTYYVMGLLIEQFEKKLHEIGYDVEEEDKRLGLIAALLHDIGHGPFSHTFENIFGIKEHEKWSIEILKDYNSEISRKIIQHYGKNFLERLIDIMTKNYKIDEKKQIFTLISQLVSSQTDADRMDYLLRDAYFTSVSNGNYDLQRLIKSFGVKKEKNNLKIYIDEKYISTLEEYVMARYFMNKEVYYHSAKKQLELIMKKIFMRASDLIISGEKIFADPIMKKLLTKENISISEYLLLDDSSLMYHIQIWQNEDDKILSFLCKSFLNRNKFPKTTIEASEDIREKINSLLRKNNKKEIIDFEKEYFFLQFTRNIELYQQSEENIWIKPKFSDNLIDFTEVSSIINKVTCEYHKNLKTEFIFISPTLFKMQYGIDLNT